MRSRRWMVAIPALALALAALLPTKAEARRGFGGGFRSGGLRSSGGFGGGFRSRPSGGGLFGRSRPAPPPSTAARRGTNFSAPPPSARPAFGGIGRGGRVVSRTGGRTTVSDGNRTVVYNRHYGGVPVPMGYSPLPFYGFYFLPWLFPNPYPHAMGAPHVGFLGSLVTLVVLGALVVGAVVLIGKVQRAADGGGRRRVARYS